VSTCYRLRANIYRNLNEENLIKVKGFYEQRNKSTLPEGSDYAVIYFYRPNKSEGALLGYKINTANDSVIGRVRNGEKFAYKTTKFGKQVFYDQLETKAQVEINVEKGQEYYVRCGVYTGITFGRPDIGIIENFEGRKEYASLK
jgi:hypothetical protein